MADAIINAHLKEGRRSSLDGRASSLRLGIVALFCTVAIMLGGLVGTFYVFRVWEDSMPYPECQLIRLEQPLAGDNRRLDGTDAVPSTTTAMMTISVAAKRDQVEEDKQVATNQTNQQQVEPPKRLELVSEDNLVKLSLEGHLILHDVGQNEHYQLNIGHQGILTHHLEDLVPRLEIRFACGRIVMYLNNDSQGVDYVTMMTGELAHGHLLHDSVCFLWRSRATGLLFPNRYAHLESHYYCDKAQQFEATVHGWSQAYKLVLNVDWLELELARNSTSPPDRYITRRGPPCELAKH